MACLYNKTLWNSYYDVTSVDFNSKKIHEDKNFSQEYPKTTNM